MKQTILFALALCLLGTYAGAVETLVDGCENTDYVTVAGAGETLTLANSTTASEGTNSLEVTYNYTAQGAWYKNSKITKTLATPIDLSGMEFFKADFNVTTGDAAWYVMIYLLDENGWLLRVPLTTALDGATGGWKTFSAKVSEMNNTKWEGSGRPVNLAKITQISLHIMNDGALGADGTQVFLVDNMRFVSGTGSLQETVLEDFESYADDAAVNAAWAEAFGRPCPAALVTADPYQGGKSYGISPSLTGVNTNFGREYTFGSTQNFGTVKYIKLGLKGDADLAGYTATAHMWLVDATGNVALASIYSWPEAAEWSNMMLTFQGTGIAVQTETATIWKNFQWDAGGDVDITQIAKMRLSVQAANGASSYPIAVDVVFDKVVLGYETNAEPIPSDKAYSLGKTTSAPTIDGTMSAGEWNDAGGFVCSGFVSHSNPAVAAAEDLEVTILYDDTYLYFAIQQVNNNFSLDFNPTGGGRDPSGTGFGGDDYELFIYPGGTMTNTGYQIVFFPNPVDSICYVWDAAGTLTGFPGSATWNASGDQAAFTYNSGTKLLTIEYRIPWAAFNLAGAPVGTVPANGTKWGLQIGHINNNPAEAVNWEPDSTAGFAAGLPNGEITFTGGPITAVSEWNRY